MHSEYAMNAAQTRISAQPRPRLAAVSALLLIVIIAILPL
jgi:hypothetical protein